jgi:hypothetical protein
MKGLSFDMSVAVERALDDAERQTGERYCTDPIILAPIARVLRDVYAQAPQTTRKKTSSEARP